MFFFLLPLLLLLLLLIIIIIIMILLLLNVPTLLLNVPNTALFISGDQTNASNYRPISILPTLSNILQRAVQFQLYDYLNIDHLLTYKQFGFRRKHSKVTALASFADDVLSNMKRGNLCGAVFLDLSKAFGTVNHSILLAKLYSLGLTPNTIQSFQSHVSHRKQRTSCGKEISYPLPVTYGVP